MIQKIAFIAGTLGQGGAEKQLFHLLRALRDDGTSLHLLSLTRGEYWEAPIRELDIPVTWVGQSPARLVRLRRITSALRNIAPHLIQSQHFYTNLYAALAGRLLRIPSVGAIRNDLFSELQHSGRMLGPLSLRLPTWLVANSEAAIANARQLGVAAHRLALLANAIEVGAPITRLPVDQPARLRLATAGRLVRQKRYDRFIRLIAALGAQTEAPVEAALYGAGPLRFELEELAQQLGLRSPRFAFRGLISDPRQIYAATDIFVLTSDWEGSPNVILEAMAAGLPVVTTRVGDLATLINHGINGFCHAPDDESGMVDSIIQLLASPQRRSQMGNQARATIDAHYSPGQYLRRVADLYQQLGSAPP
jgi:glycosyltransferase involved in cell wall biosynthesis